MDRWTGKQDETSIHSFQLHWGGYIYDFLSMYILITDPLIHWMKSESLLKNRYDLKQVLPAILIERCHHTHKGTPIVEIRKTYDHLISTMEFPLLTYLCWIRKQTSKICQLIPGQPAMRNRLQCTSDIKPQSIKIWPFLQQAPGIMSHP